MKKQPRKKLYANTKNDFGTKTHFLVGMLKFMELYLTFYQACVDKRALLRKRTLIIKPKRAVLFYSTH